MRGSPVIGSDVAGCIAFEAAAVAAAVLTPAWGDFITMFIAFAAGYAAAGAASAAYRATRRQASPPRVDADAPLWLSLPALVAGAAAVALPLRAVGVGFSGAEIAAVVAPGMLVIDPAVDRWWALRQAHGSAGAAA